MPQKTCEKIPCYAGHEPISHRTVFPRFLVCLKSPEKSQQKNKNQQKKRRDPQVRGKLDKIVVRVFGAFPGRRSPFIRQVGVFALIGVQAVMSTHSQTGKGRGLYHIKAHSPPKNSIHECVGRLEMPQCIGSARDTPFFRQKNKQSHG